ncbi:alkaline-phosphatase-like protein [Pelagophyceae sp. CCMP2097]|nr:alkaline-phosphatase-like protein [Pelagophyceae sp. CCMP2097]|mmetsp:Transcript_2592/g.9145  ORF Transcript_2592/g.9145 Transcript_2592/m.9145 type:complete len:536 (-) Transcript_2592:34-1641(-)
MSFLRAWLGWLIVGASYAASVGGGASVGASVGGAPLDKRPNFLLLFPDQWRFDWDSMHGEDGPPLRLPRLQKLAAEGTRFTQAYAPAPLCAPSRACLASLRDYDAAGMATNVANDYDARIPTLFQLLRQSGYHTMTAGKDDLTKASQLGFTLGHDTRNVANTYRQEELGFSAARRFCGKDDVISTYPEPHEPYGYMLDAARVPLENGTEVSAFDAYADCLRRRGGLCDAASFPQRLYEDDWTAGHAVQLLQAASDKPWLLWVSFPGPHAPFATTAAMHAAASGREWPRAVDSRKNETCGGAAGEPGLGRQRCDYAAELENLDRLFGLVLDAVVDRGESDSTLVCVYSDHGEMLDDHDDVGKSVPWQGAISVPLVCSGLDVRRGATVDAPVATIDVGATLLDYAAVSPAAGMTATSLRGALSSAAPELNRTYVHSGLQSHPFGFVPRDQDFDFRVVVAQLGGSVFKLVCCAGSCPGAPSNAPGPDADGYTRLLFDTVADPWDLQDLFFDRPDVAEQLRLQLPTDHGFNCPALPHAR